MHPDPIVDEVRKAREAYAARFHNDLDAMFRDLHEKEKKSGRTFVTYPPKKVPPLEEKPIATAPQK
jgi:hypothetical protein